MNPADEMVPRQEATQRQLDVVDGLKEQLRAAFEKFESGVKLKNPNAPAVKR